MRFVFVHGGFHAAWCWQHTIAELQSLGHDGVAVDLPGHGVRVDEESTLANRSEAIVSALSPATYSSGTRRRVRRHAGRGRGARSRQPHHLPGRSAATRRAHLSRSDGDAGLRGGRVRRRRRRDVGLLEVRRRRCDVVRRLRGRVEVLLSRLRRSDCPLGVRAPRPRTVRRYHGDAGVGAPVLGRRSAAQFHTCAFRIARCRVGWPTR